MMAWLLLGSILSGGVAQEEGLLCPLETERRQVTYPNGGVSEWCVNPQGMREGPSRSSYPNRSLLHEGDWRGGMKNGTWLYFWNNGEKWREDEWRLGERRSTWINPLVYTLSPEEHRALGAAESGVGGQVPKREK